MRRKQEITVEQYKLSMSHDDLQKTVIDMAHSLGYKVAGFRRARRQDDSWRTPVLADGKGYPDLTLAKKGRFLVVEIKSEHDTPSPEQKMWVDLLRAAGVEVYVWKPRDLIRGDIERILKGRS